jgi:membrane protein implicated in regulation of membrane protease activity
MRDSLVRTVCGLLGLAAAALAISYAMETIRTRDGAWYIGPALSLICTFAAYMLLRRAFRSAGNGSRATLDE